MIKMIHVFVCMIILGGIVYSQSLWTQTGSDVYYNNGRVGIGTISPNKKLHVVNTLGSLPSWGSQVAIFQNNGSVSDNAGIALLAGTSGISYIHLSDADAAASGTILYNHSNNSLGFRVNGNGSDDVTITSTGNIGIGYMSPDKKLHVVNTLGSLPSWGSQVAIFQNNGAVSDNAGIALLAGTSGISYIHLSDADNAASGTILYNHSNNSLGFRVNGGGSDNMTIASTGNIGIGTSDPSTYNLAVKGTIGAQEIEVVQTIPDYVFGEDYNLRSLEQVETFIKEESHLPDIPSAKEFEGGRVAIGEMQERHLQKIEELTLYLIEQNEINKAQAKKIEELEQRLAKFENRMK